MALFKCKGNIFKHITTAVGRSVSTSGCCGTAESTPVLDFGNKYVKKVTVSVTVHKDSRHPEGYWCGGAVATVYGFNVKTNAYEAIGSSPSWSGDPEDGGYYTSTYTTANNKLYSKFYAYRGGFASNYCIGTSTSFNITDYYQKV